MDPADVLPETELPPGTWSADKDAVCGWSVVRADSAGGFGANASFVGSAT